MRARRRRRWMRIRVWGFRCGVRQTRLRPAQVAWLGWRRVWRLMGVRLTVGGLTVVRMRGVTVGTRRKLRWTGISSTVMPNLRAHHLRGLQTVQVMEMRALRRTSVLVSHRFVLLLLLLLLLSRQRLRDRLNAQIGHHLRAGRVRGGRYLLLDVPAVVLDDDRALVIGQEGRWIRQHFPTVMITLHTATETLSHHSLVLHVILHLDVVHVRVLGLVRRIAEEADVRLGLRQSTVRRSHDLRRR